MVALKVSEIETFLARPNRPIVLIFGPDAGLVRERVEALVRKSVDDPKDPFQLARLDGDDLSSEPTRLLEEANTVPLFGGRRAVWIKAGARNFAPAVEALLPGPAPARSKSSSARRAPLEQRQVRSYRPRCGMWHSCIGRGCPLIRAPRSPRPLKASSHSSASIADLSSKRRSGYGHRHGYNVRWRSLRKPRSKHAGSPRWPSPLRGRHCSRSPLTRDES